MSIGRRGPTPGYSIGELARMTGCKPETVRYYESIGLLPTPLRSEGGHRVFREAEAKRLNFICRSRALGFSIRDVRELLAVVDDQNYTCDEVRELTHTHLQDVRRKIADLMKMETVLSEMIRKCAGGRRPDCPIVESLYADS